MPPTIKAAQHIFGSLTTEQSPTRRRGYQTLFYTRSQLTEAAVRAIEDRLQHRVTQGRTDKWQFFWLPGPQVVISYLTAVPELDEFGRKGRYLAHSVIITDADWQLLNYSPFGLMKSASFCRTMDQALALGDLKTGEIKSAATLEVSATQAERAQALASQWAPEELLRLVRLTCHSLGISERGQFVGFIGDERQINEALEVALMFPPVPRLTCSFDTSAAGCSWPRGVSFWGQGFGEEREARTPFLVDAARRRVRLPNDWRPRLTPYETWVKDLISSRQLTTIHKNQRGAALLSAVLEGHPLSTREMQEISAPLKSSFAQANQAQVAACIAALLPNQLPEFLIRAVLNKIGSTPQAQLDWLIKNPGGGEVGSILFEILKDWDEALPAEVMRSMLPLVNRHGGLRLLFALWQMDEKEVQQCLSLMTTDQYRHYVQKLRTRSSSKLWHFFSAKHLQLWLTIFGRRIKLDDIFEGISLTARYGSEQDLHSLTAIAGYLDSAEIRQELLQWLDTQPFRRRLKLLRSNLQTKSETDAGGSHPLRSWFSRHFER